MESEQPTMLCEKLATGPQNSQQTILTNYINQLSLVLTQVDSSTYLKIASQM